MNIAGNVRYQLSRKASIILFISDNTIKAMIMVLIQSNIYLHLKLEKIIKTLNVLLNSSILIKNKSSY
jgi:hypothetical protein